MNIPLSRYWDLLVDHLKPQKGRFVLLAVLLLGSIGMQIFIPQVTRYFIDTATTSAETAILLPLGLAFVGLALFQQVTAVGATYMGETVAWTATNALRAELARHCLRLDMSYHNSVSPGELIERIDGDVAELSNFFSQLVIRLLGNLMLLAGILVVLLAEDWRIGSAFTIFAVVTVITLNRIRSLAVPYDKAVRESMADLFGYLEERLSGTEDVRSSGAVDFVLLGLYKLHYKVLERWRAASMRHWGLRSVASVLLVVGYLIAFLMGYQLFQEGLITLGTAYLILHYTNLFSRPIRELTQQVESLQNIGAAVERLEDLRRIKTRIHDGPGAVFPEGPLPVDFEGISFAYVDGEPVLDDLTFHLEPGTVLGLLGRTGSGKTTLTRLLFRLYDPTAGTIALGGTAIQQATLAALRSRVAMVTQDVQLFQASVRDNLTFFDRSIPDHRILAVIEELELGEWFAGLADGLDTRLETGGRSLSAGEGQLLAFTRVFLKNPGLVILDEASSRLDPVTEQRIERAIERLLRDRTGIIVAHRLGTVHRADHIMILEAGRIAEYGERAALAAAAQSRFYSLLQTGLEEVLA